jgi:hypothetical protein
VTQALLAKLSSQRYKPGDILDLLLEAKEGDLKRRLLDYIKKLPPSLRDKYTEQITGEAYDCNDQYGNRDFTKGSQLTIIFFVQRGLLPAMPSEGMLKEIEKLWWDSLKYKIQEKEREEKAERKTTSTRSRSSYSGMTFSVTKSDEEALELSNLNPRSSVKK